MDATRHKEIMSHAETQFAPKWSALRDQHNDELREARYGARQTGNSAALLPAEAACYIGHAKALVLEKALCIANAYTVFNQPAGREAEEELETFFRTVVAARKTSFQGEVALRQMRARVSTSQVGGLLRRFEVDAAPVLVEGRAILDKQRVEINNRLPASAVDTKYVVDTCVFNWLADGRIKREALPRDGGFAITHIQVDEINKTKDEELRARLLLMQTSLHPRLLPTETLVFDVSRWDHAKQGDGRLFKSIEVALDALNGGRKSNKRDALIAEAAIANRYTLLTADGDLKSVTESHGGVVIFFQRL
jgi:predicted nucleic acid-binding protein